MLSIKVVFLCAVDCIDQCDATNLENTMYGWQGQLCERFHSVGRPQVFSNNPFALWCGFHPAANHLCGNKRTNINFSTSAKTLQYF